MLNNSEKTATNPHASGGQQLVYLLVLGAVFMLSPFAIDMYLPALPDIAVGLGADIDHLEVSVSVFLVAVAFGQFLLGPISDAVGRKRVLISGLAVFIVASGMISQAETLSEFYVWRIVQALGAAGGVGIIPMVQDRFGNEKSAKAISYIMITTIVGAVVAPLVGGLTLSYAGWPAIFLMLALLGVLAAVATAVLVPEPAFTPQRFSLLQIGSAYRKVLSNKRIMSALLTGAFAIAGLFAFVAGSPFVYITYYGIPPEYYGFLMGLNAIAMIAANVINAEILDGKRSQSKAFAGSALLALSGLVAFATVATDAGLIPLLVAIVLFAGSLEFVATNAIVSAMAVAPKLNGTVSAISGAAGFALGGVSSAAVGFMPSVDAVPMTAVMAFCGILSSIFAYALYRTSPTATLEEMSEGQAGSV